MKRWMTVAVLLLAGGAARSARAQTTVVTGTITDANGVPYSGATVRAQLVGAGGVIPQSPFITLQATPACQAAGFSAAPCNVPISSTAGPVTAGGPTVVGSTYGAFTITLYDNTYTGPGVLQWQFTVSEPGSPPALGTGPQVFTDTLTISGSSQSISSQLSNAAPKLTTFATGGGSGGGGVTSWTGDGNFFTNSASTGAVTATLGTAGGHKWWGNNTGSTATPGYQSLTAADIPPLAIGNQYALQINSGSGAFGSACPPPTADGVYGLLYNVTAGAAVSPTCPLVGALPRAVTGTTSTDTILYSDNNTPILYQGSVSVATALPTPATLGNTGFYTKIVNSTTGSATTVTLTAAGSYTFSSTGNGTLVIAQGQTVTLLVDPAGGVWDDIQSEQAFVAGTNITITRGPHGVTVAATGACTLTATYLAYGASGGGCPTGDSHSTVTVGTGGDTVSVTAPSASHSEGFNVTNPGTTGAYSGYGFNGVAINASGGGGFECANNANDCEIWANGTYAMDFAPQGGLNVIDMKGAFLKNLYTITPANPCAAVGTAASPSVATCSGNPALAGYFSCATNASAGTCQVNDTNVVGANSVVLVWQVENAATILGISTCNTAVATSATAPTLATTASGHFIINLGTYTTNPACFEFLVIG